MVRFKGLGSDLTSFLFKLIHGLLPTQDRVARLGLANDGQMAALDKVGRSDKIRHNGVTTKLVITPA